MSAITICEGAIISAAEVERIKQEVEQLKKDKGASNVLLVTATLHLHHEYPKALYRGKEVRTVDSVEAETASAADGFGSYDHEAFTAKEA